MISMMSYLVVFDYEIPLDRKHLLVERQELDGFTHVFCPAYEDYEWK